MMPERLRIAVAFRVHNVEARAAPPFHIKQKEGDLSRPEAIRRLVELGLKAKK